MHPSEGRAQRFCYRHVHRGPSAKRPPRAPKEARGRSFEKALGATAAAPTAWADENHWTVFRYPLLGFPGRCRLGTALLRRQSRRAA